MKKIFYFLAFLFVSCISYAQTLTNTENYVYSRTYLEAVSSETPTAKQVEAVQYYDGLGRNKQTIAIKSTINGKDIVVANAYDKQGRQTKSYLPIPVNTLSGAYQSTVDSTAVNTYYGVSNAYSEVLLEKSPLGRVLKVANPGADWAINTSNTVKYEYKFNVSNEVKRLKAITTWNTAKQMNDVSIDFAPNDNYTTNGFYNQNTLHKKIVKDEDNKETQVFATSDGKPVLVRKINKKDNGSIEYIDTYYVYDEFDNLVLVIPPKAAKFNTIAELSSKIDKLCYQYRYDKYNRLVEKRIPSKKNWEYLIYDNQGRPVLSQDANQIGTQWSFVKYDVFDRIAYTGLYSSTQSRTALQQAVLSATNSQNNENRTTTALVLNGQNIYYTNTAFPNSGLTVQMVHYYDDYPTGSVVKPNTVQGVTTLNATATSITSNGYTSSRSTKGLPTVSLIKNTDTNNWTRAHIWYDTKGRVIGTHSVNALGGYTKTESVLDFVGTTIEFYTYHKRLTSSVELKIKDRFVYNSKNMLLQHFQQILNNGSGGVIAEELLSDYTYNDLGQLTNKKVGNNLQSIDYTYNIRGWMTGINSNNITNLGNKLFAYKIKYNQRDGAETPNSTYSTQKVKPNYNGNITEIDWKTAGSQSDGKLRRYGFVYDELNRLRAGFYQDPNNPYSREYSEYLEYDENGNISKLNRTGKWQVSTPEVMDDLTYNYSTDDNTLTSITESGAGNALSGYLLGAGTGATFGYDNNGNQTSNLDKGVTGITYNFLNLPMAITTNNGQNVSYQYRADGTKIKKVVESKTIDYLDGFVYETVSSTTTLQFYPNAEGYYDFKNAKYIYNYKDHLGNVRLSYTKNSSGTAVVLEENNYYPFGLKHDGYNTGNTGNPSYTHKYNGKELQENGMLDYGWRNYQPELGRWFGIDQLAEQYHTTSPYAYVANNPINIFDPDGRANESWLSDMPQWFQDMWNATPSGTNSYWYNQGNHYVSYDGGSGGSGSGGVPYGSTVGYEGGYTAGSANFNYNAFGAGGFSYTYNGLKEIYLPILYLKGKSSSWGEQFSDHFNKFVNWTLGVSNNIDSFSDRIINTTVGEAIAFTEKNFNGGLGYTEVAVKGYNRIPNDFKRKMAYKLSKIINMKSGKIYQSSKAFMNNVGKIAGKLGRLSTALSVLAIGADVVDDGKLKTSSAVNGVLLGVGLAFPVTAPFVLAYGVVDYTFDIGDKLDAKFGNVND